MSAFKILDNNKQPIPINQLDKEASEFWKVINNPKYYAEPKPGQSNWIDIIGWNIANPFTTSNYGENDWHTTIESILLVQIYGNLVDFNSDKKEFTLKQFQLPVEWIKPYVELIEHWVSKGYTPLRII